MKFWKHNPKRAELLRRLKTRLIRFWNYTFKWDDLRGWGNSRMIRTSYVWLIIVPVAAKVLHPMAGEHDFEIMGEDLTVNLRLPFSWAYFFAMAIAFAIAQTFYTLTCPKLIRKFSSPSEFRSAHSGVYWLSNSIRVFATVPDSHDNVPTSTLRNILEPVMGAAEDIRIKELVEEFEGEDEAPIYSYLARILECHQEDHVVSDVFDAIWVRLNVSKPLSRKICSVLFFFGFVFFFFVMVENCRWVYQVTLNRDDAPAAVVRALCENCDAPATTQVDHADRRGTYCAEHGEAARERAGFPDWTDPPPETAPTPARTLKETEPQE